MPQNNAPEYPLLVLAAGEARGRRSKGSGGSPKIEFPTKERQRTRIQHRLDTLTEQFVQRAVRLQSEVAGVEPEQVVVLEIAGLVGDFATAVAKVEGLEWLSEAIEPDIEADDDFYLLNSKGKRLDKPISGRLFLVFSNQQALNQMLGLWRTYQEGVDFPYGYSKWRNVFVRLRDIRLWGTRDRIEDTGVLNRWEAEQDLGGLVRCEIELWHRSDPERMRTAIRRVESLVESLGGSVHKKCSMPEILYHALAVSIPRTSVSSVLDDPANADEIALMRAEDVQFIRPVGQIVGPSHKLDGENIDDTAPDVEIEAEPVSALLDGLPIQNHSVLRRHLIVDDPDQFERDYPVKSRSHGTAMASVIVNGDLSASDPIRRRIYIRPIMRPHWTGDEVVPDNELVVDLIFRAVRRMKEGEGGNAPVAPYVSIINLSIGESGRPFHATMSPLARLLDWLAWRYDVLFIVSAGNHIVPLELPISASEFRSLDKTAQRNEIVNSMARSQRLRRILSPAEGMNGLCVGAANQDASSSESPVGHVDLFESSSLPSVISALGLGYSRTIKPDLLAPGGCSPVELVEKDGQLTLVPYTQPGAPGVRVAAPSIRPGELGNAVYTRRTSVACAFVTHQATKLHDVLTELQLAHPGVMDRIPIALWIKVLLIHSTVWGQGYEELSIALKMPDNGKQLRAIGSRFQGYGNLASERVMRCAEHRATALASGVIGVDEKMRHEFPLPPSLSAQREWKRLTVTVAWFTPINPAHQVWRQASLWFEAAADALKIEREGADHNAMKRGTVQHEVFEGSKAAVFVDGDTIKIDVNCRAVAGTLNERIPYALAVTLEVKEGVSIPIYQEVRVGIRSQVKVSGNQAP